MGKPQYNQKFRSEWLKEKQFSDWLSEFNGDSSKAFCKVCRCQVRAKHADLINHSKTQKHTASIGTIKIHPTGSLLKFKTNYKTNHAETAIVLFVSAHCSILSSDHLGELCKQQFSGSPAADNLQLHRTKCSAVINNVLCPYFKSNLKDDIQNSKFSILVDESTDISITKYLGIVIIYYSTLKNTIVTTFLGLEELIECNALAILNAIKSCLTKFNLNLNNMIGLGTDNASVMVGVNNGVYKLLKDENPYIILIKCVCHSLQLAASHAVSEKLPRHLDYLISETYNWFSKSTIRQQAYSDIYKVLNNGSEPLKIIQASNTRWLSIETAVSRVIEQWYELKCHFEISRSKDKCYLAEMLYNMYKDEQNLAYLLFLKPILGEVQRVNKLFESIYIDPTKLCHELSTLISSIGKIIVTPTFRFHPITIDFTQNLHPNPYLGYGFEKKITELKKANKINKENEHVLRERCVAFVVVLVKQLQQRLPENINIFKKSEMLSPSNTLKQIKENISDLCECFGLNIEEIEKIEIQWRKINLMSWKNTNSSIDFWAEVKEFKDAANCYIFKELANFSLTVLSLPWSNAAVERIFSQMNIVKSKSRNKMGTTLLTSLLYIRFGLKLNNKCCKDFTLPDTIVKQIGTKEIYNKEPSNSEEVNDELYNVFEDIY